MVGTYAVFTRYLYIRRNTQVPATPPGSWQLAGAGNLLLKKRKRRGGLRSTSTFHYLRPPRKSYSVSGGSVSSACNIPGCYGGCCHPHGKAIFVSLGKECPLSTAASSCRYSSLRPARFYSLNDFVCCSINKWLRQFIPVR